MSKCNFLVVISAFGWALTACSSKEQQPVAQAGGAGGATASGGAQSSGGSGGPTGGASTGGRPAGSGGLPPGSGGSATGGSSTAGMGGGGTGGAVASGFPNDQFAPWHGGPSYFAKWTQGPSSDPNFFLLTVWLQTPSNAPRYKNVGINYYTGLWQGPTESQLTTLKSNNMPVICEQTGVWQAHLNDATIGGWMQPDEPDNAQWNDVTMTYDPCIDPNLLITAYNTMNTNDGTRPVYLGLGRAVADTQWFGRGTCTGRTDMYPEYAKSADILGYDIYPVNEGAPIEIVATGMDNLRGWSGYTKPVIQVLEASNFNNTQRPTPSQIKTEAWMALVHGAAGLEYFCHRFKPTFSETDCLDDAPTAAALTGLNAQITQLAPILNTQSVSNGVTVTSSASTVPVDTMLKRYAGATYLFAVAMRGTATTATFTLRDFPTTSSAEVIGESRNIAIASGVFQDAFVGYGVHLYHIAY